VNQVGVDTEVNKHTNSPLLETGFKQLWEKIRAATEFISQLREQSQKYQSQAERLENEVVRLRSELNQKEQELKRLKVDHAQLSGSLSDNNILTPEEKEALKSKIKDLIAKINSHL